MRPRRRIDATWTAWVAIRLAGVAALTGTLGYPQVDRDVFEYFSWQQLLFSGHLPWRDFPVEYPPGVLPAMLLPGDSGAVYELLFILVAVAVDAVALRMLQARGLRRGAWCWCLAPAGIGPVTWVRLDGFVAALVVAFVLQTGERRWRRAGACIAGASLLKLWPVLLLCLAWWYVPRPALRQLWGTAALVITAPLALLVAAGGGSGLLDMLSYQTRRGVEVESVWAVPFTVARALGSGRALPKAHGAGEYLVHGPLDAAISCALPVAIALLAFALHHRAKRTALPPFASACACAVAVLLVSSRVLSAQFALWALAATVVIADQLSPAAFRRLAVASAGYAAATQLVYPWSFLHLQINDAWGVVATALHAELLILWTVVVLVVGLSPSEREGRERHLAVQRAC